MESTESSQLLEVPLDSESGDAVSKERKPVSKNQRRCLEWPACTFRVRMTVLVAVFLIQIPFLVYYVSTSQLYLSGFSNSYHTLVLQRFFSKETNMRTDNITTPVLGGNLTTVFTKSSELDDKSLDEVVTPSIIRVTSPARTLSKVNVTASPERSTIAATGTKKNETELNLGSEDKKTTKAPISTVNKAEAPVDVAIATVKPKKELTPVKSEKDGSILPQCPMEPPNLQGHLDISFDKASKSFAVTAMDNPLVTLGGHAKPPYCIARHKVAIIIPFRDREEHLRYFVQYMHPVLQRQQIDYQVLIINQKGTGKFNRAKLMNIGFVEALKIYPFECFSFHDVDLILEDDRSLYWCSDQPRHMSAGVDKFRYVLPYSSIFGGVTLLTKEQMETINGFSNNFWGWGGEDDDVYNRLHIKGYKIIRYPISIARYKMISHKREKGNEANPKRFEMIGKTKTTYMHDGLNSLDYKVINIEFNPMYTNITVDVKEK